jgi:hypothetical protein
LMTIKPLYINRVSPPVSGLGMNSFIGNSDITLNTDMGFAGRIIGKYSATGQYFFQGISLTYLELNREEEAAGIESNPVYLSLKLLMAINYQQLYEAITSNKEAYVTNAVKVLQSFLNRLKITNVKGYEYVNRIYRLVAAQADGASRERIQQLLEEQVRRLSPDSRNSLSKEQLQTVRRLNGIKKDFINPYGRMTASTAGGINNINSENISIHNAYGLHTQAAGNTFIDNSTSYTGADIDGGTLNKEEGSSPYRQNTTYLEHRTNSLASEHKPDMESDNNTAADNGRIAGSEAAQSSNNVLKRETDAVNTINQDKRPFSAEEFQEDNKAADKTADRMTVEKALADKTAAQGYAQDSFHAAAGEDYENTDLSAEINDIEQFFRIYKDTGLGSHDITDRNSAGDIGEYPDQSSRTDRYIVDGNILINRLYNNTAGLTKEEKERFDVIIGQLDLREEDKARISGDMELNRYDSGHYQAVFDSLREIFSSETGSELFIKELGRKEITAAHISKLLRFITNRELHVLRKESFARYMEDSPPSILNQLLKVFREEYRKESIKEYQAGSTEEYREENIKEYQKEYALASDSSGKGELIKWITQSSDRELAHYIEALEKSSPEALDHILEQKRMEERAAGQSVSPDKRQAVDDIGQFFRVYKSAGFGSHNIINRNPAGDGGEYADRSLQTRLYTDSDNILINRLYKNTTGLTEEEKEKFNAIIGQLNIQEEDKVRISKDIEAELTGSRHYRTVFDSLREIFLRKTERELFLKELAQKEITAVQVRNLLRFITNREIYEFHKESFARYIENSPVSVQNRLLGIFQKQYQEEDTKEYRRGDTKRDTEEYQGENKKASPAEDQAEPALSSNIPGREEFIRWILQSPANELAHYIEVLEKSSPEALDDILEQKRTQAGAVNRPAASDRGPAGPETEPFRQSSPEISFQKELNDTRMFFEEHLTREYFADTDRHSLQIGTLFPESIRILGNTSRIRETLVDIVTNGTVYEKEALLNSIYHTFTSEEAEVFKAQTDITDNSYEEFSRTNELVHIIRNADTVRLKELLRIFKSNPKYQERLNKVIFSDYSLSSIKQYQEKLQEQHLRKEVKERLINRVLHSSEDDRVLLTGAINNVIPGQELQALLKINTQLFVNTQDSYTKEVLVHILKNTGEVRMEELLQILRAGRIFSGREADEIFGRRLRDRQFERLSTHVEQLLERRDTRSISSIRRNRQRQTVKNYENHLKEELIRLITSGQEAGSSEIMNLLKTGLSEEEIRNITSEQRETSLRIENNTQDYLEARELVYYIRGADRVRLERLAKIISDSPVYRARMDQVLAEAGVHDRVISGQSEDRSITFESSIINNKLRLEQTRRLTDIATRQQLIELVDRDGLQVQKTLYEFIGQRQVLVNARSRVESTDISEIQASDGKELLKRIIREADSRELEEFLTVYREVTDRRQTTVERISQEQITAIRSTLEQSIQNRDIRRHELMLRDRIRPAISSTLQTTLHQDILRQNLLLQKSILSEEAVEEEAVKAVLKEQAALSLQGPENIPALPKLRHKQEKREGTNEETVKRIVDEYVTSEQSQMSYSINRSSQTINELSVQKKEIRKLKENLQVQNKAVEDLKKQLAQKKDAENKIDINQISQDVMRRMEQQLKVARMRKGLD